MRWGPFAAIVLLLTACTGMDDTPVWSPEPREEREAATPPPARDTGSGTKLGPKRALDSAPSNLRSPEPTAKSKAPLPSDRRRALQGERQAIDAEIRSLERRARFDTDRRGDIGDRHPRAYDERRLRNLKARQRFVERRLRGD